MRSYRKAALVGIAMGSMSFIGGVGIVTVAIRKKGLFANPRDFRVAAIVAGAAIAYMGGSVVDGGVHILKRRAF